MSEQSEKKIIAEYSVSFSQEKEEIAGNTAIQDTLKASGVNKSSKFSFRRKAGQKNYVIVSGVVFAIIVLHFVFQFSFIQSENFRMLQNLTKTEQFEKPEQIAEDIVVPEIKETETEEKIVDEIKTDAKTEYKTKKPQVNKKPKAAPQSIRTRTKIAPTRTVIKRKVPQQETRAERLRRAERILTGV